jgi:hypothetical protein
MFDIARLSLVSVRSTPKGKVVVDLDLKWLPQLWSNVFNLVGKLSRSLRPSFSRNLLPHFSQPKIKLSTWIGLSLALVLGIKIGVTIFTTPDLTLAVPSLVLSQRSGSSPKLLRISGDEAISSAEFTISTSSSFQKFYQLPSTSISHLQNSARLGEGGSIILAVGGSVQDKQLLSNLSLGDELKIKGDNNGLYTFHVVTLQQIEYAELDKLSARSERLLIIVPENIFQNKMMVVAAQ